MLYTHKEINEGFYSYVIHNNTYCHICLNCGSKECSVSVKPNNYHIKLPGQCNNESYFNAKYTIEEVEILIKNNHDKDIDEAIEIIDKRTKESFNNKPFLKNNQELWMRIYNLFIKDINKITDNLEGISFSLTNKGKVEFTLDFILEFKEYIEKNYKTISSTDLQEQFYKFCNGEIRNIRGITKKVYSVESVDNDLLYDYVMDQNIIAILKMFVDEEIIDYINNPTNKYKVIKKILDHELCDLLFTNIIEANNPKQILYHFLDKEIVDSLKV